MQFKKSKVKGKEYLQVWTDGYEQYKGSIGTADNAYKLLVKVKQLEEMTNTFRGLLTKLISEKKPFLTNEEKEEINAHLPRG